MQIDFNKPAPPSEDKRWKLVQATMRRHGNQGCVVCTGTACYIKGAPQILAGIEKTAGVKPGETTPDGELSVVTARCLGSCGLAPAVVFDNQVTGKLSTANVLERIKGWLSHDS